MSVAPLNDEIERHIVLNRYKGTENKPIRVWCDGCFDLMHWGHANALRQAKALGHILVVGVHSDAAIRKNKGPPVMNESERYAAVKACKWVDEIVENAPYVTYLETLERYNIDFCVHGEDLTLDEHGNDCYALVKQAGKYKQIKRTELVSTTEIVGRMMLMTKNHFASSAVDDSTKSRIDAMHDNAAVTQFLPTTKSIVQFSEGNKTIDLHSADAKIVYIDGAFDLFHVGHIEALRIAKSRGDYLIVGVHDDSIVNQKKGGNLPIMNVHERVLSVLACRYVDEVVIGAPWQISERQLIQLRVTNVVHGTASDYDCLNDEEAECYTVPKQLGIYERFDSPMPHLTTRSYIQRILENRLLFEERQAKKAKGVSNIDNQQAEEWSARLKAQAEQKKECTNAANSGAATC